MMEYNAKSSSASTTPSAATTVRPIMTTIINTNMPSPSPSPPLPPRPSPPPPIGTLSMNQSAAILCFCPSPVTDDDPRVPNDDNESTSTLVSHDHGANHNDASNANILFVDAQFVTEWRRQAIVAASICDGPSVDASSPSLDAASSTISPSPSSPLSLDAATSPSPIPSPSPSPSSSPHFASVLAHRRRRCVAVLVKVCDSNDASSVASQQYELIMRQRLDSLDSVQCGDKNLNTSRQDDHHNSIDDAPITSVHRGDIEPHIRLLEDGQSALVVIDRMGSSMAELIAIHFGRVPAPSPLPSPLPSPSSESNKLTRAGSKNAILYDRVGVQSPISPSVVVVPLASSSSVPPPSSLFSVHCVHAMLQFSRILCRKIQLLHQEGVVHSALSPSTILLHVPTGDIQFADLSSTLIMATNRAQADADIAKTAAYRAPEQSGKMNRPIDLRSDLYSLGCIMFECMCGRTPFESDDPIELIHKHLAQTAPSFIPSFITSESNPVLFALMTVVDAIIAKLLAKEADQRYQSAKGLDHDIEAVINTIEPIASLSSVSSADIDSSIIASLRSLNPGSADQHSTFRLSSKLYGRHDDIATLQRCYNACASALVDNRKSQCVPQLVLIAGYSGIGKTSLIDEFSSRTYHRGLLARSKFDVHRRDSSAMMNAFRDLLINIQSMGAERSMWRDRLIQSMGNNASVMCHALPELIDIIGTQPSVSILDATDAAKRFDSTFVQFQSALSTPSSPLTLFIDDLQWADSSSLSLLQLLVNQDSAHLLIIGAYRRNEVSEAHPLIKMINDIKSIRADRINEIQLSSLTSSHIQSLLVDSFQCDRVTAAPLADLLLSRTQGCPFYINALIKSYYDSSLLTFDFINSRWTWQIESLRSVAAPDDAIDLICNQMTKVSSSSQLILMYAGCMGHTFTFASLLIVTQMNEVDVARSIIKMEHAGLLKVSGDMRQLVVLKHHGKSERNKHQHSRSLSTSSSSSTPYLPNSLPIIHSRSSSSAPINISFMHDKIQSAAVKLIPSDQLSVLHCNIAERMLTSYTIDERKLNAIDIVYHINDYAFATGRSSTARQLSDIDQPMDIDDDESSASTIRNTTSINDTDEVASHWLSLFTIGGIESDDGIMSSIIDLEMIAIDASTKSNAPKAVIRLVECVLTLIRIRCDHDADVCSTMRDDQTMTIADASSASASSSSSSSSSAPSSSSEYNFIRLSSQCWQSQYRHCLSLYLSLSQSLFLDCKYRQSQLAIEYALSFITDIADRSSYYELHIQSLMALQQMIEARDIGLSYLMSLNIDLSLPASPDLIAWIESWPDVNDDSTYMQHPVFALPDQPNSVEMRLISIIASVLYLVQSPLIMNCPTASLQLMKDHGRSNGAAAHAFLLYGTIQWSCRLQMSIEGCAIHRACMITSSRLLTHNVGTPLSSQMDAIVRSSISFVAGWHKSLYSIIDDAELRCAQVLQYGRTELALTISAIAFLTGLSLTIVLPRIHRHIALVSDKKMLLPQFISQCWSRLCRLLVGVDESYVADIVDHAVPMVHMADSMTSGIHQFIMRKCDQSVVTFNNAWDMRMCIVGFIEQSALVYYRCLALLSNCTNATMTVGIDSVVTHLPPSYDAALVNNRLVEADALIAQMYIWSKSCPANFEHKYMLMLAERHRVSIFSHISNYTLILPCLQLYVRSYNLARKHRSILDDALAQECKARFHIHATQYLLSRIYLQSAFVLYSRYGAQEKLKQLKLEFPNISFSDQEIADMQQLVSQPSTRDVPAVDSAPVNPNICISYNASSNVSSSQSSSHSSSSSSARSCQRTIRSTGVSPVSIPTAVDVASLPSSFSLRRRILTSRSFNQLDSRSSSSSTSPSTHSRSMFESISSSVNPWSAPCACNKSGAKVGNSFDAISVLKLTSTLSAERDHDRLMSRLMKIVIEVAAATRGTLALRNVDTDEWNIECGANVDGSNTVTSSSLHRISTSPTSDESSSLLPLTIFRDCVATSTTIILPLTLSKGEVCPYFDDPYFRNRTHRPKSILSIPLMKASTIYGVLYVENDHQRAFFNSSHIELLQLLCSQAALCIDNIRLYSKLSTHNANLELLVQQRTIELEDNNRRLTLSSARAEAATIEAEMATKRAEDATIVAEAQTKRAEEATVRAEDATREAEAATKRAEYATKVKATFLANMSHEIRTPMNAVLGVGRLLADTELSVEQTEYVGMINNSGHLLLNIINDILDFSKIEAGELKVNLEPHNVLDICDQTILLIREMMISRGLFSNGRFIDPSIPPRLMLDTMRLQQVMINLISNAIKFTTPPGSIIIRVMGKHITRSVSTSSSSSSSSSSLLPSLYELSITISDTGIGISQESLAKLFSSFSQVAHSSGSNYGGTGLGLVIASKLVQAMNDAVKVNGEDSYATGPPISCISEVGVGSTFGFKILCTVPDDELDTVSSPICLTSASSHDVISITPRLVPPRRCIYGLTDAERSSLSELNILFVARDDPASRSTGELLRSMAKSLHICPTIESAEAYVNECRISSSSLAASYAAAASAEQRISVVVVDIQSIEPLTLVESAMIDPRFDFLNSNEAWYSLPSMFMERQRPLRSPSSSSSTSASILSPSTSLSRASLSPLTPLSSYRHESDESHATTDEPSSSQATSASSTSTSLNVEVRRLILMKPYRHPTMLTRLLSLVSPVPTIVAPVPSLIGASLNDAPMPLSIFTASASPALLPSPSSSTIESPLLTIYPSTPNGKRAPSLRLATIADDIKLVKSSPSSTRPSSATAASRMTNIASSHPLRVLLAEDNLINQKMMIMMMRKLGYTIMTAINGVEALAALDREAARGSQYEIECILMDASMDVMDGMECTRRIRQEQRDDRRRPYIIAQTANVTDEYRVACLESGMDQFTVKPVIVGVLSAALKQAYAYHHS